jgi:uncharacterized protein (DUF2267 family)
MQAHEFLGQVQDKAHLGTLGEAMRATRATLETLAERLGPDDSRHLAEQLPHEIQLFLSDAGLPMPERFSPDEFLLRVSAREGIAFPESSEHARVVIDVLTEAVSPREPTDVLARLAEDYRELFAGAGKMPA